MAFSITPRYGQLARTLSNVKSVSRYFEWYHNGSNLTKRPSVCKTGVSSTREVVINNNKMGKKIPLAVSDTECFKYCYTIVIVTFLDSFTKIFLSSEIT